MEADLGLDLWPGPDHWDGLHFVGFNVGISFIITECYANVASNHPSIKIAALRSPDQNSRAFRVSPLLWLHSVSKVNVSSSRPPPPPAHPLAWISPRLNSPASPLPHLLLSLDWLSTSDYILAGDPPSLVSSWTWTKTVRQCLRWRNPSYQVQIMVTTWNSCRQSLQALPICLLREFLNVSRFCQIIPLWHYEISPWGI